MKYALSEPQDKALTQPTAAFFTYQWKFDDDFSEKEIRFFEKFLWNHAQLLYKYAAQRGANCASASLPKV